MWRLIHTNAALVIIAILSSGASAYTPESPEVRAMIDRAVGYLEKTNDNRWGGKCIIGLVFLKEGRPDHPKVQEAVLESRQRLTSSVPVIAEREDIYSIGLATIFLCELDPHGYREEIEKLLQILWVRQLEIGGWTYPQQFTGDTSMTQYAVLACWTAHVSGFSIPPKAVQDVCNWLVRTQDASGGFAYQPSYPDENEKVRRTHNEVRESTTVGGLGSLYVCSELLGIQAPAAPKDGQLQFVPAAFTPVRRPGEGPVDGRPNRTLAPDVKRSISDGNKWLAANFTTSPSQYRFYYLYGLERYHSFREQMEGNVKREPDWYNAVVRDLMRDQQADGRWSSESDIIGEEVNTAFATLCLMRSTKKSLERARLGDGMLVGGHGLPTDTRRIRVVDGQVVSTLDQRTANSLARILATPDSPDFTELASAGASLLISSEPLDATEQERLRQLIQVAPPDAKRLAVRALSSQRDLDNVPILIEALSDKDRQVVQTAHQALRRVSRRLRLPDLPKDWTEQHRQQAVLDWKRWYGSIRPEGLKPE